VFKNALQRKSAEFLAGDSVEKKYKSPVRGFVVF
jgi:hypothetical protein